MSAEQQTELLAAYILHNIPNEPSQSEGAGECAVRLLESYRRALGQIAQAPNLDDAHNIAVGALEGEFIL